MLFHDLNLRERNIYTLYAAVSNLMFLDRSFADQFMFSTMPIVRPPRVVFFPKVCEKHPVSPHWKMRTQREFMSFVRSAVQLNGEPASNTQKGELYYQLVVL